MTPAALSIAQSDELAHLERCAQTLAGALEARDNAVRRSRAAGLSLRQIAAAAGMTAMGVRGICERGEHG